MYKKIIVIGLVIGLGLSNIYFYNKAEKMDYAIIVGTTSGNGATGERTDLSKPLSSKDEANTIIFSLIDGMAIEKPPVSMNSPDSVIWFNDWNKGVSYLKVNLWKDGNSIIMETNANSDTPIYRKLSGGRATEMGNLLEKYSTQN